MTWILYQTYMTFAPAMTFCDMMPALEGNIKLSAQFAKHNTKLLRH